MAASTPRGGPETIPVNRPAPPPRKPGYSRRIVWLGVVVLLAVAAYTAAWFWAANRLESLAGDAVSRLDRDPVRAECANLHAEGFPFRIGLFCSRVAFRDEARNVGVEAGAFRSAAQIYNPFLVVGEVDGPARVQPPDMPPLDLSWDVLKTSIRLDRPLPERVSLEARALKAAGPAGLLLTAADMQAHLRPNGGDVDVAGNVQGLTLAPELTGNRALPPLSLSADATLSGGVAWALSRDKSLRGRAGILRGLRLIASDKASLVLSGPFSVDGEGRLSADWTVALTGAPEMAEVLAEAFPGQADAIRTGFSGLALLGDKPSLPLRIENGQVRLAFVRLGEVPPLR